MDVISGCDGSSENVARQIRFVSSGQDTVTELSLRTTVIGPGRTAVRSSGTETAARLQRHETERGEQHDMHDGRREGGYEITRLHATSGQCCEHTR